MHRLVLHRPAPDRIARPLGGDRAVRGRVIGLAVASIAVVCLTTGCSPSRNRTAAQNGPILNGEGVSDRTLERFDPVTPTSLADSAIPGSDTDRPGTMIH